MKDQKIVALIKKRSEKGMQLLINEYSGLVRYIAIKILGNNQAQEIEECLSDVFYEVWCKIEDYDEQKGSLKSFVGTIAKYRAIDRYRKVSRHSQQEIPLEEDTLEVEGNLEETVLQNLDKEVVNEVIDELKEPDREIFIRHYYFFERVKEIASRLQLDEKLVENILYRGKQRLRVSIEKRGGCKTLWNVK